MRHTNSRTLPFRSLVLLTIPLATVGQTASHSRLKLREPIQRELSMGHMHSYVVALKAGQYMNVEITQPAFAVVVQLFAPATNEKLTQLNLPGSAGRHEFLCWVANTSGEYRIELAATEPGTRSGGYAITLEEL